LYPYFTDRKALISRLPVGSKRWPRLPLGLMFAGSPKVRLDLAGVPVWGLAATFEARLPICKFEPKGASLAQTSVVGGEWDERDAPSYKIMSRERDAPA